MQQAGKPVQQQGIKRFRLGDVAGGRLAHHHAVAVRERRLQLRQADRGHQQVIGGTDKVYRAGDAGGMAAKIGLFQRVSACAAGVFALKVRQRQSLQPPDAVRGRPSSLPDRETAAAPLPTPARHRHTGSVRGSDKQRRVWAFRRQPAVDAHQRFERIGVIERQLQADQRPSAWPTTQ